MITFHNSRFRFTIQIVRNLWPVLPLYGVKEKTI